MVRRWKIRTKLFIAVTLLLAIIASLAASGFWGLYQYRRLANSVSQRAIEIPYAAELNRFALMVRESHVRTGEISSREGMIDSSALGDPLFDIAEFEHQRFDEALMAFDFALQRYEAAVHAATDSKSLLVDLARQQRSLGEIRIALESLKRARRASRTPDPPTRSEMESRINGLVERTDEHLKMIHGGMAEFSDHVRGQYRTWIGVAWSCLVGAIVVVVVLAIGFQSLVVKPFRTLLDGSRLVAGGQFNHRIDLGTGDELSELAIAMNDMTDRFQGAYKTVEDWCSDLDQQVQLRTREVIQNEQLASVGFLAAGVAHEINNPLAAIAWSAESLQSRVSEMIIGGDGSPVADDLGTELSENLQRIEDEAYRCKGITEKLLDFSRLSEVRRASTDLSQLVNDVVSMVGTVGKYRCKSIHLDAPDPIFAHVNPQEIRQVVLNLVTNALESVDTSGSVRVRVHQKANMATVLVEDDGCGMTEEVMKHLFEPFFTRRRDGTGTGLGLSITYRIISQHGGSLVPHSDGEGRGSRMEMSVPIEPECDDCTSSHRINIDGELPTTKVA